jgi:HK97 family phage prohead protease
MLAFRNPLHFTSEILTEGATTHTMKAMSFTSIAPGEIPRVTELHESTDGTGLEISGLFATWDEDSANESFLPNAFDAAIGPFMKNPVVLHHHNKHEPPIGFVKEIKVTPQGLWGSIILPAPTVGTKAFDCYHAVKAGLLSTFSVGGLWIRHNIGGRVKLMCRRLLEISLTSQPANPFALAGGVTAVQGVKSIGGEWLPDRPGLNEQIAAAVIGHEADKLTLDLLRYELAGRP